MTPVDPTLPYDDQNIFAKILRGELPCTKVYEDEWAFAFEDIHPQAPEHILVLPKGAYVSWDDFSAKASAEEIAGFVRAIGKIARDKSELFRSALAVKGLKAAPAVFGFKVVEGARA